MYLSIYKLSKLDLFNILNINIFKFIKFYLSIFLTLILFINIFNFY